MGILSNIFGNKKDKEIKTDLETLPNLLKKNFDLKTTELEMFLAKRMSELKFLYESANARLKEIENKEIELKENERFNKAALTSKNQIEKQMQKILEKINPSKTSTEIKSIYSYSKESFIFLFNEVNSYRKSIVYTSIYLKDEMKELGNTLGEILKKFEEINKEIEQNKDIFEFEKTKEEIEQIKIMKKEIENKTKKSKEFSDELNKFEGEIKNIEIKINDLNQSSESKVLINNKERTSELLNQKQSLKIELTSMISTVEKPLNKYLTLAKGGREKLSKDDIDLLEIFLTNPIYALKKDIKGEKIKEILKKILKAIEDEKIELKEKEKEKRTRALIEIINFDFFGRIFWKINEIQKEINSLEEQTKTNPVAKKILDLENEMSEIKRKISSKKEELNIINTEIEKNKELIDEKLLKIKTFSQDILNTKIIIEFN